MLHKDPVDAMLDLALGEDLATGFRLLAANYDPAAVVRLITMPSVTRECRATCSMNGFTDDKPRRSRKRYAG
jgi:hypothetical protein